jgi:hypothetical protein
MWWEKIFFGIMTLILISFLVLYWFFPGQGIEFGFDKNNNFSLNKTNVSMQFYENMRFPYSKITYKIEDDCILQKKNEMVRAFEIIANVSGLKFIKNPGNPEIIVTCDEKNKVEEGMFIAGEGGPTQIVSGDNFNVILAGKILLIKNSNCERPNIAIHELLHVLGFDHSENANNIMYPVSKCRQTIGKEIPLKIKELYSVPSLPDLEFEEVSATINGRMIDINMSIKNNGLVSSKEANIMIYGDEKIIKEIELNDLDVGYEVKISLTNLLFTKLKIEQLRLVIESNYSELSKDNNQVFLTKNQITN